MPDLEGPLVLDAETLKAIILPPTDLATREPTFQVVFRGAQTAGTPLSFQMIEDADLTYMSAKGSGILVSKTRIVASLLPAATFSSRRDVVAFLEGATTSGSWTGRLRFLAGDFIWIDSIAGMGANEYVNFVFVPVRKPAFSSQNQIP